ncbi:MAG: D-alanyl-D-alanine carboxypeptidase [Austwickia sp.]|nr:D-alanyl-D-alanine carboxypeptidase [Austwickia sp.]
MRRARWTIAAAVLAVGAYVGLDIADVAPGALTTDRPVAAPTGAPAPNAPPGAPAPAPAGGRLLPADAADLPLPPAAGSARQPSAAALAATLDPLIADHALGPAVGAMVRDARTGQVLYEKDSAAPRTPASTTKLLTAAAVATSMPMSATLDTTVVRGAEPGEIVLVAGGDTLLSPTAGEPFAVPGRAGLADLADQVAARLRAGAGASGAAGTPGAAGTSGGAGTSGPAADRASEPVTIRLDEGALAGPRIDPAWVSADVANGYAGPVAPLGLTTYRPRPGQDVPTDPALATAVAFRDALAARGVVVTGRVSRGAAPATAERLGLVRSAPVGDQLALALAESDNTLSSALARVAAVRSGKAPTFDAVSAWVSDRVAALGAPTDGLAVADPSGLAPGSRASAATLAAVLLAGTQSAAGDLARVTADLPTAGLVGTLANRYLTGPQRAGAGVVRAKTGTLTGVSSLAGTVLTGDGRLLVFAVLADRVPATGTEDAREALDRFAAALAGCGCR